MEGIKKYSPPHKHIAIKHGRATFYGEGEPSNELLEVINKMAELAYEQCGGVKVDTGENNALLPDVINCPLCGDVDYYAPSENCSNPTCNNYMGF